MDKSFKEESFKSRNKKLKKASDRFLYTFLIVFLAGYTLFFTSNLWLPNAYLGVEVAPIGETISKNDRNVTIDEWTSSKEQRMMEVVVEIDDLSIDAVNNYVWLIKTKDGPLETKVVASDKQFVVLHALNVPKDWVEASLTMDIQKEDKDKVDSWSPIVIYTNDKIVSEVPSIKEKELKDYKVAAYEKRIAVTKEKIKLKTEEAIPRMR